MTKIIINEKLFAHINTDPFLLGSVGLQGNQFGNTVGYLNQYLAHVVANGGSVSKEVTQLSQSCSFLTACEQSIEHSKELNGPLTNLAITIQERAEKLTADDNILLPGGWQSANGSHAMVYQIHKDAKGDLLLSIHNSGSGLEYHAKQSDKEKELYNPVLTYKIPKEKIKEPNFIAFMEKLLAAQLPHLHKRDKIGPEYIYETILPTLSYLDGNIVAEDPKHIKYTAGQLSGTCTQRSLHEMLKSRFPDLDAYRTFIYHFKAYSLDDYITQLRSNKQIANPKYHGQIDKAIRHQLRLLNLKNSTDPTKDLFPPQIKEQQKTKLLEYLSELRRLKTKEVEVEAQRPTTPPPAIATQLTIGFPQVCKVVMGNTTNSAKDAIPEVYQVKGGATLLEDMDELIRRCTELSANQQDQAILEHLEHFFTHMPLPEPPNTWSGALMPFYQGINSEQKSHAFFKKMSALQNLYFNSCSSLFVKQTVLPRMYVVKLSIITVAAHVNAGCSLVPKGATPFFPYISGIIHGIAPESRNAAYLATNNPQLDKRYQQLRDLNKDSRQFFSVTNKTFQYYQNLIDAQPVLKEKLEALYKKKYINDQSQLHQVVSGNKCTSLYYLINNLETVQKQPEFEPLLAKFRQQEEIEQLCGFFSGKLSSNDTENRTTTLNIKLPYDTATDLGIESTIFNQSELLLNRAVQQSKYGLSDTAPAHALKRDVNISGYHSIDPRPSNQTQLIPAAYAQNLNPYSNSNGLEQHEKINIAQRQLSKQDLEDRELFHLRRMADHQINLTLDYFGLHPEKLRKHEMQIYAEANLFQPGLLLAQLSPKQSALFFKQFDDFITNGLKYYEKKGLMVETSLFYIRMAYLVNQYANQLDPEQYGNRLNTFIEDLNRHLSCQIDPLIKASLHQYRFLSLLSGDKNQLTKPGVFLETLTSYFYIESHNNEQHPLDMDSRYQITCAKHHYRRLLQTQKTLISKELSLNPELLLTLLKNIGIKLNSTSKSSISGNYPEYLVTSGSDLLIINIESGLVFKENLAYHKTPLDILNHPLTQKFGMQNQDSCFISPNGMNYSLEHPPTYLRFIKEKDSYRIQKKWRDAAGQERWYELRSLSEEQASYWQQTKVTLFENLPTIMKERDALTWQCLDNDTFLMSDTTNKIQYQGTFKDMVGEISTQKEKDNRKLVQNNSWIHQRLQDFENPSFVTTWANTKDYAIHLDRYGLKLSASTTSQDIHWSWEGSDYRLINTPPVFKHTGIAHLRFRGEQQDLCIFPVQPFINSTKRSESSEYYHFVQDTAAQIPQKVVEKLLKTKNPQCWQYTGKERFIAYKMKNGQPIPMTTEEALYLCYIYLGSNQPDKAWAVLEDCDKRLGGLAGTYEEIRYLNWIINALPYQLEDNDSKATIATPPYVACQLKALSLLTQFSLLDKGIVFPKAASASATANGRFEQHAIEETQSFYNETNGHIYSLYSKLQAMRRELPADYTLSHVETKSLLDHYHKHLPQTKGSPAAVGALGYEWVQLNLDVLHQEMRHLDSKAKTRQLTHYEQRRKNEITQFLSQHQGVAKVRSRLEYFTINLEIPESVIVNQFTMSVNSRAILYDYGEFEKAIINEIPNVSKQQQAINALVLGMTDETFFNYFNNYLHITLTPNHPLQKTLINFCKATLIAYRHVPLNEQSTNLPLFCNIIYRLVNKTLPAGNRFQGGISTFPDLITYASKLPAIPIEIPQLRDDTSELMISAQDLWNKIPEPDPLIRPTALSTAEHPRVVEWFTKEFIDFRDKWQVIEQKFQSGQGVSPSNPDVQVYCGLPKNEFEAGCVKYDALKEWQSLAKKELESSEVRERITTLSNKRLTQLAEMQNKLLSELLDFVKQGPEDPRLKQQWSIDIASGKRKAPTINDLLRLYFHADVARYSLETGLTNNKINQLHELLTSYVAQGIQHQQCQRILKELKSVDSASQEERPQALFVLGQTLCAENQVDVVQDPALSLFQYHGDMLLRPQQKEALKRLLTTTTEDKFSETIEKIIMGGGKSKIILPTLAQKKATGNNLVIIEVPRSLLRTNYIDLKATSSALFNQNVYLFEFNRDTDCSPKRLEEQYNQLAEVMVNKGYMVTTGDALPSLELKYLELLLTPQPDDPKEKETWKQQVIWAERLVLLFKERGDLIIDEVHQGLLYKAKLNYPLGESSSVSKSILQYSIGLYQFFNQVNLGTFSLHEALIKRKALLTNPVSLSDALLKLAEQLVQHKDSPLNGDITELNTLGYSKAEVTTLIQDYLLNKGKAIPKFILEASPEVQEKFAFYKEQVSNLLPFTLKRKQGEHYGPSKLATRTASERLVAIPYIANDTPNERSRFGNELEAINYTIQSLEISGLTKEMLHTVLSDWIVLARGEINTGTAKDIDETSIAALFRGMVNEKIGFPFSQLDPDNKDQLSLLHEQLSRNPSLIYEVLKSHVLPLIKTHDAILHSDAYSHVDTVRSCQGMSGTPSNHSTFHQRLHFSEEAARGTDAYVLRAIQEKKPVIRGADFTDMSHFINTLFAPYTAQAQIRVIIDINASFKGISNLAVSCALGTYIQLNQSQFSLPNPLKYILFFNEQNVLSALRVQEKIEEQEPILLGTSDPRIIQSRLNCGPECCFTFYDQAHTVGADIKLSPKAKGIVLVDQDTKFQSFLQGSMRERDLIEGVQSIDLNVPTAIAQTPLDELIAMQVSNEKRQLQQENFDTTLAKMANVLRTDFKNRLLLITGVDAVIKKQQFLTIVKEYFVEFKSKDFFDRYGGLDELKSTTELLNKFQKHLLSDWQRLMQQATQPISTAEQKQIETTLEKLVAQASAPGVCAPMQITRKNALATEVEVQQEKQTQVQLLMVKEVQKEFYDPSRLPESYEKWGPDWRDQPKQSSALQFKSLNAICQTTGAKDIPVFNSEIIASKNFYKTYVDQDKFIGMYLKPVHALLFRKVHDKLECVLLTQDECNELHSEVSKNTDGTCWISTTQHTLLAGTPPSEIRNDKTYQSIIEQIRFFNGELNLLLHRDSQFSWLEEKSQQKLTFYSRYLWPCHETLATDISTLTDLFSLSRRIFLSMARQPWIDQRKVRWESRFPDCEKDDIRNFKNLADAFHEATCSWNSKLNSQELCTKFNLTLGAIIHFVPYVEQLSALREFITLVNEENALAKQNGTPFDVLSKLTTNMQTKLATLCPELALISNNNPDNKEQAHYKYLTTLMNTMPMCKAHPEIMTALSFNKHLNEIDLETIINTIISNDLLLHNSITYGGSLYDTTLKTIQTAFAYNDMLLCGLLTNSSPIIKSKHIAMLGELKSSYGAKSMLALAKHPCLSEEQYMSVINRAKEMSNKSEIFSTLVSVANKENLLNILLSHKTNALVPEVLFMVANQEIVSEKELLLIFQHPLITENILALIATKAKKPDIFHAIFEKIKKPDMIQMNKSEKVYCALVQNPATPTSLLIKIAESTLQPATINYMLEHPKKDKFYPALVNNQIIPPSSLLNIAKSTGDIAIFTAILSRVGGMPKNGSERDSILSALIENKDLIEPDLLNDIESLTTTKSVLNSLLKHKGKYLEASTLFKLEIEPPDEADGALMDQGTPVNLISKSVSPIEIARENFYLLLNELRLIRKRLLTKTTPDMPKYDKNYLEVRNATETLYDSLHRASYKFFQKPTPNNFERFKRNTHLAINTAKKEFIKHRGNYIAEGLLSVLRMIVGILPKLFAMIFPGSSQYDRQKWVNETFFMPKKTELAKKLEKLEKSLAEQEGIIGNGIISRGG